MCLKETVVSAAPVTPDWHNMKLIGDHNDFRTALRQGSVRGQPRAAVLLDLSILFRSILFYSILFYFILLVRSALRKRICMNLSERTFIPCFVVISPNECRYMTKILQLMLRLGQILEIGGMTPMMTEKQRRCHWFLQIIDYGGDPAQMVDYWTQESNNYDYASNKCSSPGACDRFLQMAWAKTTHIGCGMSGDDFSFVVCNYGPGMDASNGSPYVEYVEVTTPPTTTSPGEITTASPTTAASRDITTSPPTTAAPGEITTSPPTTAAREEITTSPTTTPARGEITTSPPTTAARGEITTSPPTTPARGEITTAPPTTPAPREIKTLPPTTAARGEITTAPPTTPARGEITTSPPKTAAPGEITTAATLPTESVETTTTTEILKASTIATSDAVHLVSCWQMWHIFVLCLVVYSCPVYFVMIFRDLQAGSKSCRRCFHRAASPSSKWPPPSSWNIVIIRQNQG
ncbi:hypothetical protein D915_010118 [Fasciola hepatica]|uniref:SCP domain-containing protein n=1 Tax=Fasciola hepatica TaxID=6192 RepID=A0A4E0RAR0_FASHE|nr:hypothetical protein D915_010118 [Fasciola hepatica]